jgi:hypothetical protein
MICRISARAVEKIDAKKSEREKVSPMNLVLFISSSHAKRSPNVLEEKLSN